MSARKRRPNPQGFHRCSLCEAPMPEPMPNSPKERLCQPCWKANGMSMKITR